jgi:hypothetical protein
MNTDWIKTPLYQRRNRKNSAIFLILIIKNNISMKKLVMIISIAALMAGSAFAQNNNHGKTDWEKFGLKGKVKSVTHLHYKPVFKYGEIVKGEKTEEPDGDLYLEYDKQGKITTRKYAFSADGGYIIMGTKYIYANNGRIIEERDYFDRDGSPMERRCYEYNDDEKIVKETFYGENGKLRVDHKGNTVLKTYKYDDKDGWYGNHRRL